MNRPRSWLAKAKAAAVSLAEANPRLEGLVARRVDERLVIRRHTPQPVVQHRDPVAALDLLRGPELASDGPGVSAAFWERQSQMKALRESPDLATRVRSTDWYHTIELPGGVVTPGYFDHRPLVPFYGLPASLAGRRALDVATFDGFWAFELERRGAEVTALDLASTGETDLPPAAKARMAEEGIATPTGAGFEIASAALGSKVARRVGSVYDLAPESWGTYDVVHVGDLLLHLERPWVALQRIRSVVADGGFLHLSDACQPGHGEGQVQYQGGWQFATWWVPDRQALCQWVIDAGFSTVEVLSSYRLDATDGARALWRAVLRARP